MVQNRYSEKCESAKVFGFACLGIVEAAGVELDRVSETGRICRMTNKNESMESPNPLKKPGEPPNCPQQNLGPAPTTSPRMPPDALAPSTTTFERASL